MARVEPERLSLEGIETRGLEPIVAQSSPFMLGKNGSPHTRILTQSPGRSSIRKSISNAPSDRLVAKELTGLLEQSTNWPFLIFSPLHPARMAWDMIVILCLFYIVVFTPLEVTYGQPTENGWQTLGSCVDMMFWLDIILGFRTAFMSRDGEMVTSPYAIAVHYISDFFMIDFLCCLPGFPLSTIIEKLSDEGDSTGSEASALKLGKAPRVLRVVRSVKMVKVLRIVKVALIIEELRDTFPGTVVLFKMLKLLITTSFFLHVNACCFSLVSQSQPHGSSWVDHVQMDDWISEYVNALYWSTTTSTTVGYGDITPVSDVEKVFGIISMAIGVGLYGYIIGSMTEVVTSQSYVSHLMNQRMDQVFEFIRRHDFPSSTRKSIIRFCRHHFLQKKYVDERFIMDLLPPLLMEQVRSTMLQNGLQRIRFFRFLDLKYFARAFQLLEPRQHKPGEELLNSDIGPSPEFFIIREGKVHVYAPTYKSMFTPGATTHKERFDMCYAFCKDMFDEYDTSGDGNLDVDELKGLLEKLSDGAIKPAQVEAIVMALDTDGSGTIGLQEFANWFMQTRVEVKSNIVLGKRLAVCDTHRPYGVHSAFNLGHGEPLVYRFFPPEHVEYWVVNAEAMLNEFDGDIQVLELVESYIVAPARRHGAALDLKTQAQVELIVQKSVEDLEDGGRDSRRALRLRAATLCKMVNRSRRSAQKGLGEKGLAAIMTSPSLMSRGSAADPPTAAVPVKWATDTPKSKWKDAKDTPSCNGHAYALGPTSRASTPSMTSPVMAPFQEPAAAALPVSNDHMRGSNSFVLDARSQRGRAVRSMEDKEQFTHTTQAEATVQALREAVSDVSLQLADLRRSTQSEFAKLRAASKRNTMTLQAIQQACERNESVARAVQKLLKAQS